MSRIIDELKRTDHKRYLGGLDFFKSVSYTHLRAHET